MLPKVRAARGGRRAGASIERRQSTSIAVRSRVRKWALFEVSPTVLGEARRFVWEPGSVSRSPIRSIRMTRSGKALVVVDDAYRRHPHLLVRCVERRADRVVRLTKKDS